MVAKETSPARNLRRWLPGVIISVIALAVLARFIHWQDLLKAISSISPIFIAAVSLCTILFLIIRGFASRALLENKVSFRQAFLAINVGYLLNNLLPLRAGEIGRAVLLGQTSGLGTMHILSTIVIERVFDMAIAAGLLLSTLPMALGMEQSRPIAIVILVLVILGLVAMWLMARFQSTVHAWAGWVGQRVPLVQKYIVPQLDALLRGMSVLVNPRRFLVALSLILLSWVVAVSEYYVMMLALRPANPQWWWGLFIDSVLALGIAIPSAPGAVGVFEGAIVAALGVLGFTPEQGLAYAVIIHAQQWMITAILGFYGLASQGQSLSTFFKSIRLRESARNSE